MCKSFMSEGCKCFRCCNPFSITKNAHTHTFLANLFPDLCDGPNNTGFINNRGFPEGIHYLENVTLRTSPPNIPQTLCSLQVISGYNHLYIGFV